MEKMFRIKWMIQRHGGMEAWRPGTGNCEPGTGNWELRT